MKRFRSTAFVCVLTIALSAFVSERSVAMSSPHGARNGTPIYQILYRFRGTPDGAQPQSVLTADASGALYGTTNAGGTFNAGTVFKLTPRKNGYTETILYSFEGYPLDGQNPAAAGVVVDATGTIYGTTSGGGPADQGTVYELTRTSNGYQETLLHIFQGGHNDGSSPMGTLIGSAATGLIGTTAGGGEDGEGTVFSITSIDSELELYQFFGGTDGGSPLAGVIADAEGALYGTASGSSYSKGAVFRLGPAPKYAESLLHEFKGHPDGESPRASLAMAASGDLFGTTYDGGLRHQGMVFALLPSSQGYTERVVHNFRHGTDGRNPASGVVLQPGGLLYGTTTRGGAHDYGTLYMLSPAQGLYHETILHDFDLVDGADPQSDLMAESSGTLYGVTANGGGSTNCSGGCGVIFRLRP